jgi:hypothetical protein
MTSVAGAEVATSAVATTEVGATGVGVVHAATTILNPRVADNPSNFFNMIFLQTPDLNCFVFALDWRTNLSGEV